MKHQIAGIFFLLILTGLAVLSVFMSISIWIFVLVLVFWFSVAAIGSSFLQFNYHLKAYCRRSDWNAKQIAITFDDGPSENTIAILKILRRYDAKATFFCIGRKVEKHPQIVQQIVSEGHLIGNHSYSHSDLFDFYTKSKITAELAKTDALVQALTEKKMRFFRPPFGVTTPSMRRALKHSKYVVMGWSIRSMDGISRNANAIFKRIMRRLKPGAVVLLHDNREQANIVLEQLLQSLREKNYEVVSLETLFDCKAYEN